MLQQKLLKHFFEIIICQHKMRVQFIIQWRIQEFFLGGGIINYKLQYNKKSRTTTKLIFKNFI